MVYIKGSNNIVADALSWSLSAPPLESVDLPSIACLQETDKEVSFLRDRLKSFSLSGNFSCDVTFWHHPYDLLCLSF